MRSVFLLALLLLLGGHAGFAQLPDTLTAEQVREDIRFTARTIESMHPNPWHSIPRKAFYRLRDSLLKAANRPIPTEDAWHFIARLCAALNEGHTHATVSPAIVEKIQQGRYGVFPVLLDELAPGGFRVQADLSDDSSLRPGDRLLSINGRSAADILTELTRYSGGLPSWRRIRMKNNILAHLHLVGIRSPYAIRYRQNGAEHEKVLTAVTYQQLLTRIEAFRKRRGAVAAAPPYSIRRLPGDIAVLDFNHMEGDPKAFYRFLEDSFRAFRSAPIKGFVVDMRRNGGGNSVLGWNLLQFITDKPFRMSGDTRWKVSPEGKNAYLALDSARRRSDSARWAPYLAQQNGYIFVNKAAAPEPPPANELRFRGPVAVLIGPNTFSSANMTVNTIQDYQLATLIGEPSGEPANDYGEILYFDTPNAKVNFCSSTRHFIRANGDARDPNPVLPDIHVPADPEGKTDPVLEAAIKWIGTQR
ncbi:S41 family peptidase [Flaviaesturariibacter amylovorans]|uniref:PDZ domain-containing protein n=1 Tax=Flaviaesturariibacter amylovorans TaxID=1084520 RepID=A0ABP8HR66_9BACT